MYGRCLPDVGSGIGPAAGAIDEKGPGRRQGLFKLRVPRRLPLRPQKALASATLAVVPIGLWYALTAPVVVSVTVIVYSRFDKAP